jgi:hypothetical protein
MTNQESFSTGWRYGFLNAYGERPVLTARQTAELFPDANEDAFHQGNLDGVNVDRWRLNKIPPVVVRWNTSYHSPAFRAELFRRMEHVRLALEHSGAARISAEAWAEIRDLPGFSGGPAESPTALVVVAS